jgi:Lrp/AsnC family leucine-responsive transcriptional regulator
MMASKSNPHLDQVDRQILKAIQENARIPYSELGRLVGLTPPAVKNRLHRMEDAGIILGYRAELDPEKLGLPITAFITLTTTPKRYNSVFKTIDELPEVQECHHLTGEASFIMKVNVGSIRHMEALIETFSSFGETKTSVVLSSPISGRQIKLLEDDNHLVDD